MFSSQQKKEQARITAIQKDSVASFRKHYKAKEVNEWRNEERDTLLCLAVMHDAHACAQTLLNDGADPLMVGHCGETPFSYAMRQKTGHRLFTILNAPAQLPKADERMVKHLCHVAVTEKAAISLKDLFEYGLPQTRDNIQYGFWCALKFGKIDDMSEMLALAKQNDVQPVPHIELKTECNKRYHDPHHPVRQWLYHNMPDVMGAIGMMPKTKTELADQVIQTKTHIRGPKLGGNFNQQSTPERADKTAANQVIPTVRKGVGLLKVRR